MCITWPIFLSTLSLRRATFVQALKLIACQFLSTLSLRRATQIKQTCRAETSISIHALLAESDLIPHMAHLTERLFLSTLSLRRATTTQKKKHNPASHFYPRSPCGERPTDAINGSNPDFISIHALLAESDSVFFIIFNACCAFLSTLSLRRATQAGSAGCLRSSISIHALLAESDCARL